MTSGNEHAAAWIAANRAMWDERVPLHAASALYDQEGFRAGRDEIRDFEAAEVGDVTGKRLLHLQCHMGQDTLSWARRGAASVVGLDFSAPAIVVARGLAADIGFADRAVFVVSDVYEAPAAVPDEDYDIVYTGIGALYWLPDIERWAATAASLVAPGGFLYLAEFHPFLNVFGWESVTEAKEDYFRSDALVTDEPGSYVEIEAETIDNLSYARIHTLGDIVSAICAAGLRLEFLHEHEVTVFQQFPELVRGEDGYFRLPEGRPRLPLMYSLKASRPA
ncbi:class I SAM-dependent methyltransferase [Glycomyces algeriensis]|uniref:Type 12 methyltransferase n=1 Tax=Glycomyces algeriensis TaxID=256037 RepID=A0A9W6G9Q9_9ACTN|nr:class I SAM-dependent methyltransferase [Glycomyces algeriensis]MDA1364810.1 class I SAM-dependent methyltransferase [Glycomyces algeriensis]MDR7350131.1 SAM-dependent methyltransferase [Glycomyces algeriensis]GLI42843.1 type 12 methyltransferase [Glycomyces algeriensis]